MGSAQDSNGTGRTYAPVPFGRKMREQFLFEDGYTNLNHGSFGTYPRPMRDVLHHFQDLSEARPDRFIRFDYAKALDKSREELARILHAPLDELVLVSNATMGINSVLRSLIFEPGDHILYFSTTYGACGKTVEYVCEYTPATSLQLNLDFPLEDDEVVDKMREAIREVAAKGGRAKVALLDTVISMPGLRMPFERLVDVCREEGVLSLVDGAHGVGHVQLDLAKLDADFFVSNCHKWLFVPRGCAVFHVPVRNQPLIRSTLPTSHGWKPRANDPNARDIPNRVPSGPGKSDFVTQFEFIGTLDNSPYLCIPAAMTFRNEACGGEDKIRAYCFDLARKGGQLVADALGTEVLTNKTGSLTQCCLVNVRLPFRATLGAASSTSSKNKTSLATIEAKYAEAVIAWMQRTLAEETDTFIAIYFHDGNWWARLSAQVYLDLDDFALGGRVLKTVCERVARGEFQERVEMMESGKVEVEQNPI